MGLGNSLSAGAAVEELHHCRPPHPDKGTLQLAPSELRRLYSSMCFYYIPLQSPGSSLLKLLPSTGGRDCCPQPWGARRAAEHHTRGTEGVHAER